MTTRHLMLFRQVSSVVIMKFNFSSFTHHLVGMIELQQLTRGNLASGAQYEYLVTLQYASGRSEMLPPY